MKRFLSLAVGLLIAALLCFFTAALAQEPTAVVPSPAGTTKKEPAVPTPDKPGVAYKQIRVLKGGNLALIAERCGHRQTEWRALVNANPSLPNPEKFGELWRVWIQPDQILNLPRGWNYGTLNPEYAVPFPPAPQEARGPEGTTPPMPPENSARTGNTGSNRSLWWMPAWLPGLLVILAVVLVILWLAGVFRNLPAIILSRRRNPWRYPAVVPGGLSNDPTTALAQITAAYPGRTVAIRRIVRGHFVKADDSAPDMVQVGMAFRDGVDRPAYIRPGDSVYQALLEDGTVEGYYLQACGNAISRFQKPAGWRFVVGEAVDIPRPAPPISPVPPIPPTPPVPPAPPAPVFPAEPPAPTAPASAPEPATAPEPTTEPEPSVVVAEAEETAEPPAAEAEQTLTPSEVEVTVDGLLIRVVGRNGEIPATKIRTGGGVEVTLQQP